LAINRATEPARTIVTGAASTDQGAHCALSVDVEDYFQVWAFSSVIPRQSWDQFELRAIASTERLLDLFDRRGAKATFFILGWIGERAPHLVRKIADRGHEVASHGYDHTKVFDQTAEEFRADLLKTKDILEQASGVRVNGFRAAGFSIDSRTPWAYAVLRETGHLYSSSSHPIAHDHYGDPNASRAPELRDGVIEAPVAVAEIFGRRISCGGGGWFRATPYPLAQGLFARARASIGGPAIFYLHPWEIDPGQPRVEAAPLRSKLRHYVNLDVMEKKLDRLLSDFEFTRIDKALGLEPGAVAI
jgi:polysaccharide deacetylase family protein (PEP-CTERM system associated)